MPKQLCHKAISGAAVFGDDRMEPFAQPQPVLDQREKEDMLSMFNYFGWDVPEPSSKRKAHNFSVAPAAPTTKPY